MRPGNLTAPRSLRVWHDRLRRRALGARPTRTPPPGSGGFPSHPLTGRLRGGECVAAAILHVEDGARAARRPQGDGRGTGACVASRRMRRRGAAQRMETGRRPLGCGVLTGSLRGVVRRAPPRPSPGVQAHSASTSTRRHLTIRRRDRRNGVLERGLRQARVLDRLQDRPTSPITLSGQCVGLRDLFNLAWNANLPWHNAPREGLRYWAPVP